jgi:RNA polymerase sigma-70 factor (ECF subfamily)
LEAFDNDQGLDSIIAETPVPEQIRDEDILVALGKLPLEFREVVLMADVQEFSYREVADTLKIPLGTVMSRLSRGRKLLRQELAEVARAYGIQPSSERKRRGESG